MLTLVSCLWSVAQVLGGLVNSFGQFFGARVLLGIGEAPQFPTSARVVRDWFNERERGLAPASGTLVVARHGHFRAAADLPDAAFTWRWMFGSWALSGSWSPRSGSSICRDPRGGADVRGASAICPRARVRAGTPVTLRDWGRLFRFRTTWGMIFGFFGTIYMLWMYSAWLPGYLEMQRHMGMPTTGWLTAIPFLFGVIGSIVGGRLSDRLVERGFSTINSRKYPYRGLLGTGIFTVRDRDGGEQHARRDLHLDLDVLRSDLAASLGHGPVAAPANCTASIGLVCRISAAISGGAGADGHRLHRAGDRLLRARAVVGAAVGLRRHRVPADRPRPRDRVGRAGPGRPRGRRLTPDFPFDLDRG